MLERQHEAAVSAHVRFGALSENGDDRTRIRRRSDRQRRLACRRFGTRVRIRGVEEQRDGGGMASPRRVVQARLSSLEAWPRARSGRRGEREELDDAHPAERGGRVQRHAAALGDRVVPRAGGEQEAG